MANESEEICMKRKETIKIIVVIILCISFVIVGICSFLNKILGIPKDTFQISGNVVENDYNNYNCSNADLVRIEDKLYFRYKKSFLCYGIIEISQIGTKRIFWEGPKWFGSNYYTPIIRSFNDNVVMEFEEQFMFYSPQNSTSFAPYDEFNNICDFSLGFQEYKELLIYERSSEDIEKSGALLGYTGNYSKLIVNNTNIACFYIVEDDIYYLAYIEDKEGDFSREFRKYNIEDKTDIQLYVSDAYTMYEFTFENNYIVFSGSHKEEKEAGVYKINLANEEKSAEEVTICHESPYDSVFDRTSYNVFNNTIYVTCHHGLTAYDLVTNESVTLYEGYVDSCYIVDDTWVYFVGEDSSLWRILQTGGTAERVYG